MGLMFFSLANLPLAANQRNNWRGMPLPLEVFVLRQACLWQNPLPDGCEKGLWFQKRSNFRCRVKWNHVLGWLWYKIDTQLSVLARSRSKPTEPTWCTCGWQWRFWQPIGRVRMCLWGAVVGWLHEARAEDDGSHWACEALCRFSVFASQQTPRNIQKR